MTPNSAITILLALTISADKQVQIPPPPSKAHLGFHWRWHDKRWIEEPNELVGLLPNQWYDLPSKSDGKFFAIYGTVDGLEDPLHLLLDSGSTHSYLSESAWKKCTNQDPTVIPSAPVSLKLTGTLLLNLNVRPANLARIDSVVKGIKLDGILGIKEMAKVDWKLDYSQRKVSARLHGSAEFAEQIDGQRTLQFPMIATSDGRYSVNITVGKPNIYAIVDTGADGTSIATFNDRPATFGRVKVVTAKGLLLYDCYLQEQVQLGANRLPWMIFQTRRNQTPNILGVAGLGADQVIIDWLGHKLTVIFSGDDFYSSKLLSRLLGFPVAVVDGKIYLDSGTVPINRGGFVSNVLSMSVERIGPYSYTQILMMIKHPSSSARNKVTQLGKLTRKGTSIFLGNRTRSIKAHIKVM